MMWRKKAKNLKKKTTQKQSKKALELSFLQFSELVLFNGSLHCIK